MVRAILKIVPRHGTLCLCGKACLGNKKETKKFYIWICPECGSLYYYRKNE